MKLTLRTMVSRSMKLGQSQKERYAVPPLHSSTFLIFCSRPIKCYGCMVSRQPHPISSVAHTFIAVGEWCSHLTHRIPSILAKSWPLPAVPVSSDHLDDGLNSNCTYAERSCLYILRPLPLHMWIQMYVFLLVHDGPHLINAASPVNLSRIYVTAQIEFEYTTLPTFGKFTPFALLHSPSQATYRAFSLWKST